MQETVIGLGYHRATVYAGSGHIQSCPYRVTGEQLIVGRNTGKFYHTKLHGKVVYQLLYFLLCDDSLLQISLKVNVKEGGYTSYRHCGSVLGLDGCQISKVQPLDGFPCVYRRS